MKPSLITTLLTALIALVALALPAQASTKASLCIYDPAGANGDVFNLMKDYRAAAAGWGVDFTLKPYTDEKTAAEDFKAGQCTAALITGTRARPFQKFSSTVEAMGALPTYGNLKSVVSSLLSKKAARFTTPASRPRGHEPVDRLSGGYVEVENSSPGERSGRLRRCSGTASKGRNARAPGAVAPDAPDPQLVCSCPAPPGRVVGPVS